VQIGGEKVTKHCRANQEKSLIIINIPIKGNLRVKMKYPIIKIPGPPRCLKNTDKVRCVYQGKIQRENHIHKHGVNARTCGKRPDIFSGIDEKERMDIAEKMRHCWGKPIITGPVCVSFLFKIPAYEGENKYDLSNSEQIYEDLLQEQTEGMDLKLGIWLIKRIGANIIKNDKQIQSHDRSRFWWLCQYCEAGKTGKRTHRKGAFCPGQKKCPHSGIEIAISDWVHPVPCQEEIDYIFGK
jgi:hypothetical protein